MTAAADDPASPSRTARRAGLVYVTDDAAGITRRRRGRGWSYHTPDGELIRDPEERERIEALAIPPAWEEVWICPRPEGHLQATGRDDKGRKQYRYHPRWRELRDETKYERLLDFGAALPRIRSRVGRDLGLEGLPRRRVLALAVRLLDLTGIRVGNAEYAEDNGSYGLTTLRRRHVEVRGSSIRFAFVGKSGREQSLALTDRRLARLVRRCREIPGYEVFKYIDDEGERRRIGSADVNEYLREVSGEDLTAKHFRTWVGTILAAEHLEELGPADGESEAKSNVLSAIDRVAEELGNRRATCRKYYVHPAVVDAYLEGDLLERLEEDPEDWQPPPGLRREEIRVMRFLRHHDGS